MLRMMPPTSPRRQRNNEGKGGKVAKKRKGKAERKHDTKDVDKELQNPSQSHSMHARTIFASTSSPASPASTKIPLSRPSDGEESLPTAGSVRSSGPARSCCSLLGVSGRSRIPRRSARNLIGHAKYHRIEFRVAQLNSQMVYASLDGASTAFQRLLH